MRTHRFGALFFRTGLPPFVLRSRTRCTVILAGTIAVSVPVSISAAVAVAISSAMAGCMLLGQWASIAAARLVCRPVPVSIAIEALSFGLRGRHRGKVGACSHCGARDRLHRRQRAVR